MRERDHGVGCRQLLGQGDRIATAVAAIDTDQNCSKHRGSSR
jgi:hypothetical protein